MAVTDATSTRITSLYSGMDTDALVKNSLTTQQNRLDKIFQDKEKAQWRLDAYNDIYSSVNSLRNSYLSVLGDKSVIKNATYNTFKANITENSAISVSAGESALPTSFNIQSIEMATASGASAASRATNQAKAWGTSTLTLPEGKTLAETTVAELKDAFGLKEGGELQFGVNGKLYTFDPATTTMEDIQNTLRDEAGVTMTMTEGAANEDGSKSVSFSFTMDDGSTLKLSNTGNGNAFGENSVFGVREGTHYAAIQRSDTIADALRKNGATEEQIAGLAENGITINGKNFKFDVNKDTLRSMMTTINDDDDAGAVFGYSEITGKFSISSAETGVASTLDLNDEGGNNTMSIFGLTNITAGNNSKVTLTDGTVIEETSNNFTRDGISFNITDNYTAPADSQGLRVSVEQDYQPTVDAIKQFVTEYNSLLEKLNTHYTEESFRKYTPLTEEQREELTEDEAKKWDEKAKSGVLRNDATIGSLLTELRQSLSVKNETTGLSVMDLGISTVSWDSSNWKTDQGKLMLDENKLLQMLKDNPDGVQNTLSAVSDDASTTNTGYTTTSKEGFFTRINKSFTNFASKMRKDNISATNTSINGYEDDYDEMLEKYYEKQEALYLKYAQMETALSKLQSQTNGIMALFNTGS